MNESDFKRLIGVNNLLLAWRRVTTAKNTAYKKYFREVFYAYELAAERNIRDLSARLSGHAYVPQSPSRLFVPKSSGLNRSITLLRIEDQIVLQAVANFLAHRTRQRRAKVEGKLVFSNFLNADPASIFFLEDWRRCYAMYVKRMESLFQRGYRWIANFDLAAFYDTVSHELLFKTIYSRSSRTPQVDTICKWLEKWIAPRPAWLVQHGIPQGPQSSDFLAEIFLLPIDEAFAGRTTYVRYVDDIRLFGKTEYEVQAAVQKLEVLCRDRGLIPQSTKFEIRQAVSLSDAVNAIPSLAGVHSDDSNETELSSLAAERHFRSGLGGRPLRVIDKSRVRFVLFRGSPSTKLRNWVLSLAPHHPEHIEAFAFHLSQYRRSSRLIKQCVEIAAKTPYPFVKGELLLLLAKWVKKSEAKKLIDIATALAKDKDAGTAGKLGAMVFLCRAEKLGLGRYSRFILTQPDLVRALAVPHLPDSTLFATETMDRFLQSSGLEPVLALTMAFLRRTDGVTWSPGQLAKSPVQVRNIYVEFGVLAGGDGVDAMAETLHKRFGSEVNFDWRKFFGTEYGHAQQQLIQAEKLFSAGRSLWLSHQNSFNNCLFLVFQKHLNRFALPGKCLTVNKKGELVKYGTMLLGKHPFPSHHPVVANALDAMNRRRNKLDASHPYDEKTRRRNLPLKKNEQTRLVDLMNKGLNAMVRFCQANGIP